MTTAQMATLRAARPDVILLVGGTDGGNADVLLHNGSRLAKARMGAPVVVAGNIGARAEVADGPASRPAGDSSSPTTSSPRSG